MKWPTPPAKAAEPVHPALAKELAPSNIQVNAIACGVIDTRMNACFDAEERAELENEIPAGRFADPSEVADFVQQLIDAPSYLTGQIISFDGDICNYIK